MISLEEKYGNTLTLLRDGGVPLTVIQETTKGVPSLEGKLNALEALQKEKGIDPWTQYSALVETTLNSGKLTGVEIKEAVANYSEPEKKLAALRKKLNIKENKPERIKRENGGRVDFSESAGRPSNEERVQAAMKKHKCSFREAHVMCGLPVPDPDMTESLSTIADRAKRWKRYSPSISESDAMGMALKGIEPR
jgi:hypothetical protein